MVYSGHSQNLHLFLTDENCTVRKLAETVLNWKLKLYDLSIYRDEGDQYFSFTFRLGKKIKEKFGGLIAIKMDNKASVFKFSLRGWYGGGLFRPADFSFELNDENMLFALLKSQIFQRHKDKLDVIRNSNR